MHCDFIAGGRFRAWLIGMVQDNVTMLRFYAVETNAGFMIRLGPNGNNYLKNCGNSEN